MWRREFAPVLVGQIEMTPLLTHSSAPAPPLDAFFFSFLHGPLHNMALA